jgi:peptidoglycan/xylan/chitin deacetylase (PgdA/CDA1 family)
MKTVPILLYHSIGSTTSPDYRQWCVDPALFGEHLDVVKALGYTTMTVTDFVDRRGDGTLPSKPCVITFDDGCADFIDGAMPVLEAHGVPATMYMVSGFVGGCSSWLPMVEERERPMLGWGDLRQIAAAGVEVGAHSDTHIELDIARSSRLEAEIADSRARLSDGLGTAIRSFAYPHGYHSPRVVHAVRVAGYDSAVAVKDRWSHDADDRFALARMFVWGSTEADDLHAILSAPPTTRPIDTLSQRALRRGWRYTRWVRSHVSRSA